MALLPLAPENGAVVPLHTPEQDAFIADESGRAATSGDLTFCWDNLRFDGREQSIPRPAELLWTGGGDAVPELSLFEDFSVPDTTIDMEVGRNRATLWNLLIGKTYFWRVRSGHEVSPPFRFTTQDKPPRLIHVQGNTNFRDLGGYHTRDGRVVRQGMLYRCSEFDTHLTLSEAGARTMVERLGIKTDLDLRGEAVGVREKSELSDYGVAWHLLPITPYDEIFTSEETRRNLARIFELLASGDVYPLAFHCWGGADRGGTLAFLIEALLGVDEADCIMDYEFTSMSIWGIRTRNYGPFDAMLKGLRQYGAPGASPADCVTGFLLSLGIEFSTLERLKTLLLDAPQETAGGAVGR